MQQRVRRFAFFLGGVSLVAGGLIVVACGTDNGTPTPTPSVTDANTSKDATGTDSNTSTDGGTDSATDPDCSLAPKLRDTTNGFYCSFYRGDNGDGGTTSFCKNDEICCNPTGKYEDGGFIPAFCATQAAAGAKGDVTRCQAQAVTEGSGWGADGGTAWECADSKACGAGQICCLITRPGAGGNVNIGPNQDKAIPQACEAKQSFKENGTRCVTGTACAADQIRLCSLTDNNCSGASKCTPFEAFSNRDLGYCFP